MFLILTICCLRIVVEIEILRKIVQFWKILKDVRQIVPNSVKELKKGMWSLYDLKIIKKIKKGDLVFMLNLSDPTVIWKRSARDLVLAIILARTLCILWHEGFLLSLLIVIGNSFWSGFLSLTSNEVQKRGMSQCWFIKLLLSQDSSRLRCLFWRIAINATFLV